MKTQEDVLSFHDLEVQRGLSYLNYQDESDGVADIVLQDSKNVKEMSERWIHTFLEWDLYDKYIYHLGWRISFKSMAAAAPIISTITRVDTLNEAKIMAVKKVNRLLGEMVHLEQLKVSAVIIEPTICDRLFKVIDWYGSYRGMVEIEKMEGQNKC